MQSRGLDRKCKNLYTKGFYLKEKIVNIKSIAIEKENRPKLKINLKRNFHEIKWLKLAVIKKLNNFSKKSPITRDKILIGKRFYDYLFQNYKTKSGYECCSNIIKDFNLVNQNFFSEKDNCYFNPDSFKIRIAKPRATNWKDRELKIHSERANQYTLWFEFLIEDIVVSSKKTNKIIKKLQQPLSKFVLAPLPKPTFLNDSSINLWDKPLSSSSSSSSASTSCSSSSCLSSSCLSSHSSLSK